MRVKVGHWWFAPSKDLPVMVELTEQDKWNIAHMAPEATKYACFADDDPMDEEQKKQWMKK